MAERKLVRFDRKEMFKLGDYMRKHYTASGLNNIDFAKQAAEALNMPGLNKDHINNILSDLEIENNFKRRPAPEVCASTAMARLSELEERVKVLSTRLLILERRVLDGWKS